MLVSLLLLIALIAFVSADDCDCVCDGKDVKKEVTDCASANCITQCKAEPACANANSITATCQSGSGGDDDIDCGPDIGAGFKIIACLMSADKDCASAIGGSDGKFDCKCAGVIRKCATDAGCTIKPAFQTTCEAHCSKDECSSASMLSLTFAGAFVAIAAKLF
eukprot:TRINITY_DN6361_c0_g1_i1.p2 TRINITY_DN6361_c0_g1~~TRINITY_DN6361_c0_g1_i1.p2  ORF type:complete len:164 (-),score=34.12 TRINITY_DN6361_c0_g1_i1:37-528(-)